MRPYKITNEHTVYNKENKNYPLQVEDCSHLCETSKLVPDGPGGHSGQIRHERPKLFIKLQPSKLHGVNQQKMWIHYVYSNILIKHKKISNMMLKIRR